MTIHRTTDPSTSAEAARNIAPKLNGKRALFVRCLSEMNGPRTAAEVAAWAVDWHGERCGESVRKRAKECVRLGYIAEAGTKVCGVTGQKATSYRIR